MFETWKQTVDRVIGHQEWLWKRAKGSDLDATELVELEELRVLMYQRKVSMSGRTLWLGGTEVGQSREASMFNCSFLCIQTVYDCVDALWLLLNGCGVGFAPRIGTLNGFGKVIPEIEFITSTQEASYRGRQNNVETFEDGVWTIGIGDSAEAWAKALGKIVSGKFAADKLVIDTSEVRGPGERLNGYGWICAGDVPLVKALRGITTLLNRRAGSLLTRMDILDLVNWMGTILSTRRSAEIALFCTDEPEWEAFAVAKKDCSETNNPQRFQSNNSLVFNSRPDRGALRHIFNLMEAAGGSEPGFVNAVAARLRAPWFYGVNPCVEILLGDKSFCNLTEVDLGKFIGDSAGLHRALYVAARANYRQTCVDLNDGILQESWHQNNYFLRLCGVGLTGIVTRDDLTDYDLKMMQRIATSAAFGMAQSLELPYPKNVTTVKPSGTLSKIMDTPEGIHKPLGRYIFNNVNFSKHDPLLAELRDAGYAVRPNPVDPEAVLVVLPFEYKNIKFNTVNGLEINTDSALTQLRRYRKFQKSWTQQNTSITISYDLTEVDDIIDWLLRNWDDYVGVSFIYRTDPTMSAEDLGYSYLPQEVVTKAAFKAYTARLTPVKLVNSFEEILEDECPLGFCPTK